MKAIFLLGLISLVHTLPLLPGVPFKQFAELNQDDQAFVTYLILIFHTSNSASPNNEFVKGSPEDEITGVLDFCNLFSKTDPYIITKRAEALKSAIVAKDLIKSYLQMHEKIYGLIAQMPLYTIQKGIEDSSKAAASLGLGPFQGPSSGNTDAPTDGSTAAMAPSFPVGWAGFSNGTEGFPPECPSYPGSLPGMLESPGAIPGSQIWFPGSPDGFTGASNGYGASVPKITTTEQTTETVTTTEETTTTPTTTKKSKSKKGKKTTTKPPKKKKKKTTKPAA